MSYDARAYVHPAYNQNLPGGYGPSPTDWTAVSPYATQAPPAVEGNLGYVSAIRGAYSTFNTLERGVNNRSDSLFQYERGNGQPGVQVGGTPDYAPAAGAFIDSGGRLGEQIIHRPPNLPNMSTYFTTSQSQYTMPQVSLNKKMGSAFSMFNVPMSTYTQKQTVARRKTNTLSTRQASLNPAFYNSELFSDGNLLLTAFPELTLPTFIFTGDSEKKNRQSLGQSGDAIMTWPQINSMFQRVAESQTQFELHPLYGDSFRNPLCFFKNWSFMGYTCGMDAIGTYRESVAVTYAEAFSCVTAKDWWVTCNPPPRAGGAVGVQFVREFIPRPGKPIPGEGSSTKKFLFDVDTYAPDGLGMCGDALPSEGEINGELVTRYRLVPEAYDRRGVMMNNISKVSGGQQLPGWEVGQVVEGDSLIWSKAERMRHESVVKFTLYPDPSKPGVASLDKFPDITLNVKPNRYTVM